MRPLCGAIVAAGAMIGLGLTALGLGIRYQYLTTINYQGDPLFDMKFKHVDNPLQFCLVILTVCVIIGLGMMFVGLAYHHERRQREHELMAKGHSIHRAGV
jgi:hypothetical protein